MAAPSIAEVWDDSRQFLVREHALLLPIGLACFGTATLLVSLVTPPRDPAAGIVVGPWMLWLIPVMLLAVVGSLTISAMALGNRLSVEEGFRIAFRLLPRAIGLLFLVGVIFATLAVVAGIIAGAAALVAGMGAQSTAMLATFAMLPLGVWLSARLLMLWPAAVTVVGGVGTVLRHSFAVSRGQGALLVGLMMVNLLLFMLLAAVLELAGGSVLLLLARLLGAPELGPLLVSVLVAAFNGAYATAWAVFVARLYARMQD